MAWVYFIQSGDDGPIKIGKTGGSVEFRLAALQCGNPEELVLLAAVGCPQSYRASAYERRIHEAFASDRLRGEWFKPSYQILAYIETLRRRDAA